MKRLAFFALVALILAGCSTSSTSTMPTPPPSIPHLYVGNDNAADGVRQYTLPISGSSTQNFTVPVPAQSTVAVAVDPSGNLAVGELSGHLQFFPTPLSGTSVASATFNNGASTNTGAVAFTTAGDLFATGFDPGGVKLFTHPFSNASVPSQTVNNAGLTSAGGLALDSAANLYVGNATPTSNLFVWAPPYSGAPIITANAANSSYRKMTVSATQLFVCVIEPNPLLGRLDVFNLPITAASVPAFSMRNGMNLPEAVALDSGENLYVGNLGSTTINVYTPPFSATSTPAITLVVSAGAFAIFGIAIGP